MIQWLEDGRLFHSMILSLPQLKVVCLCKREVSIENFSIPGWLCWLSRKDVREFQQSSKLWSTYQMLSTALLKPHFETLKAMISVLKRHQIKQILRKKWNQDWLFCSCLWLWLVRPGWQQGIRRIARVTIVNLKNSSFHTKNSSNKCVITNSFIRDCWKTRLTMITWRGLAMRGSGNARPKRYEFLVGEILFNGKSARKMWRT